MLLSKPLEETGNNRPAKEPCVLQSSSRLSQDRVFQFSTPEHSDIGIAILKAAGSG